MTSAVRSRSNVRKFALVLVALGGAAGASVAYGQATLGETAQTLDRVDIIYPTDADNVAIDTTIAGRPWVASEYGMAGASFTQCQNTATRGMYCLDGNVVRLFPNPKKTTGLVAGDAVDLFTCGNAVFNFDRDNVCTALTADISGNIWVAGKKRNKFSLFKIVQGATQPAGAPNSVSRWTSFTTSAGTFWAREYAAGRPLLVDLAVIDGDLAAGFPYGGGLGGILAVEERREVTFFPDVPQALPTTVGRGGVWALNRGEQLQSATLVQKYVESADTTRNWALITTSAGRLLSRELPWVEGTTTVVTNHTAQANLVAPASCGPTALYDIQSSVKTRAVYVSDRRGCRALALTTNIDETGFGSTTTLAFAPSVVIASTSPTSGQAQLDAPPEAVSIAPGVAISMKDECVDSEGCALVGDSVDMDETTVPAASMSNVQLDPNTPDGLTVFQIKEIPDCRYIKFSLQPAACKNGAILTAGGRVINDLVEDAGYFDAAGNVLNPETLYLNVTPLMPIEVTKVKTLPAQMLISPRYRALDDKDTFDALFGVTQNGVRFRETFDVNLDLADLIPGRKLGCGRATATQIKTNEEDIWFELGPRWDVVLTISENVTVVGGLPNGQRQFADALVNTFGCTNTDPPNAGTRWSMYAYGLQMAKERVPNRTTGAIETRYSDSIFAKLTASLFADLGATIQTYVCTDRDGAGGVPPVGNGCSSLYDSWRVTNDKLIKCIESSTEPLNSTEIRACNAFDVQYGPFATQVNALTRSGPDPANRVGEVKARLEIFRSVYEEQFLPSIPAETGFSDPL